MMKSISMFLLVSSSRFLCRAFFLQTPKLYSSSSSSSRRLLSQTNQWNELITSPILLQRLQDQLPAIYQSGPTEIQSLSFQAIQQGHSAIVGAETGTGKTLAYLLPFMNAVLEERQQQQQTTSTSTTWDTVQAYARAVVLVPNKELVQQVLRMALPLAGGPAALVYDGTTLQDTTTNNDDNNNNLIRLAVLPGGLKEPNDYVPFRRSTQPLDLIVTTPAALGPWALSPKHVALFADIQTLFVDEADMLLDGGYVRALEQVLMGFRRAASQQSTQYIFVAATLPDAGLRSVDAYLKKKFPAAQYITTANLHNAKHEGLLETQWYEVDSKQERMKVVVEMLQQQQQQEEEEKTMIFLNSVQDVENASAALQKAGISVLKYHAKLNLQERTETLEAFRSSAAAAVGQKILVCTDLASRGLDVPDVSVVIQLQFATNVVTHLHRMGRCGRKNHTKKGRGIIFYSKQEEPLVQVVRQAEEQQEKMTLQQDVEENLLDGDENERNDLAKVQQAFSRKRGFTKKRKKLRRFEEQEELEQEY